MTHLVVNLANMMCRSVPGQAIGCPADGRYLPYCQGAAWLCILHDYVCDRDMAALQALVTSGKNLLLDMIDSTGREDLAHDVRSPGSYQRGRAIKREHNTTPR